VNTETTESVGKRGSIFHDAGCPRCQAARVLAGPIFAKRGFDWVPLQTPGVAGRLGLSESALMEEMKLQLADGRVFGGIDSWIVLFRSVWWLWPFGVLLSLPGFYWLGQGTYRWLARNRYCFSGQCKVRKKDPHHRKIPFLDLP